VTKVVTQSNHNLATICEIFQVNNDLDEISKIAILAVSVSDKFYFLKKT
jgi:hypothetical protein